MTISLKRTNTGVSVFQYVTPTTDQRIELEKHELVAGPKGTIAEAAQRARQS